MDTDIIITLAAIFLCLLCSAFFASAETAITAVSRARIYHLIMEGDRRAKAVEALRKQKERLIGGIMIGNNTVNILGASLATDLALRHWGSNGVLYATVVMTFIVVLFGEVLPKTYAIQNSEFLALKIAPSLSVILRLLHPLNVALQFIVRPLLRAIGVHGSGHDLPSASDVIRGTIELHHHEGAVVKQDRDMLGGILDMQDIAVSEVMAHRLNMETVDIDQPEEQIIEAVISSSHSRIPLWQGEPDNIIGVLHTKTLIKRLRELGKTPNHAAIRAILVAPWFIPETTTLKTQLHAFRARHQHLALVVDEYGVLQGLVTLEDIIEEIVGQIEDEHDIPEGDEITSIDGRRYQVQGSMTLRDLNRELGWNLSDDEASTIAGLVMHEAQMIPDEGQVFEFHGVRFTILAKQGNQITRLELEQLPELEEDIAAAEHSE